MFSLSFLMAFAILLPCFDNLDGSEVHLFAFFFKQSLICFSYGPRASHAKCGRDGANCSRERRFPYFITFVPEPAWTALSWPCTPFTASAGAAGSRSQRLICGLTRDTIGIYSAERETGEMVIARNETRQSARNSRAGRQHTFRGAPRVR